MSIYHTIIVIIFIVFSIIYIVIFIVSSIICIIIFIYIVIFISRSIYIFEFTFQASLNGDNLIKGNNLYKSV